MEKLNEKYKGKYIGSQKISKIEAVETKTYLGKPRVRVCYEAGGDWVYPVKALEAIVTDDVSTATGLQNSRLRPVISEVLTLLLEADLTIDDAFRVKGAVMSSVMLSLDDAVARGLSKLIGRDVYFNNANGNVTLMDLDDMLTGKLVAGRKEELKK